MCDSHHFPLVKNFISIPPHTLSALPTAHSQLLTDPSQLPIPLYPHPITILTTIHLFRKLSQIRGKFTLRQRQPDNINVFKRQPAIDNFCTYDIVALRKRCRECPVETKETIYFWSYCKCKVETHVPTVNRPHCNSCNKKLKHFL